MKKTICIITSSFPSTKKDSKGFAGVFVKDFAEILSSEYDVVVLAPGTKNEQNENFGFKVIYFPWFYSDFGLSSLNPKKIGDLFRLFTVVISGTFSSVRAIRKADPELCVAMWAIPSGIFCYAAKILFNKPYIVWALGSDIWKVQNYPMGKVILKKVLSNAKKLYADGKVLANDVLTISNKKCEFLPSNRILKNTNENVEFDKNKINFIYLGRYHENKGTDLLIDAISKLDEGEKNKIFVNIYGQGPLDEIIKNKVDTFGLESCVKINGVLESDRVFSYIKNSNFVIIPSRIESIPLILSDSMQAGKPVVATDVGDMGEIINKFNTGIVTKPTSDSIAEGIKSAIKLEDTTLKQYELGIKKLADYLDIRNSIKVVKELID